MPRTKEANGEGESPNGVVRWSMSMRSSNLHENGTKGRDGSTNRRIHGRREDVAVDDLVQEVGEADDLEDCQAAGNAHVPVVKVGLCFLEACVEIPPIWTPHRIGREVMRWVESEDVAERMVEA